MFNNFYINPQLTDSMLQKIINEARVKIVRMYVMCQDNFVKGVELLEAMHANVKLRYESQMIQGAVQGQSNLQQQQQISATTEELITSINNEIGDSPAGESLIALIDRIEITMNDSKISDSRKQRINIIKERLLNEIANNIERIQKAKESVNDDSNNKKIKALIEIYKSEYKKMVK